MRGATFDRIAPLLDALRAHPALLEVRPTEFQLDGRDFLHFHDEPEGVVADVRLAEGRVSMPVSSSAEQAEFLDRIDHALSSFDVRLRDRQRRHRRRRGEEGG
jgi:hypothetical protein